MSDMNDPLLAAVPFYATAPYACSYLPDQQARSQVVGPAPSALGTSYSMLVANGFRRSGLFTYRPYCDACKACTPLRVSASAFKPNRAQRRAWSAHESLHARIRDLEFDPEHFALYHRYQSRRHQDGGMDLDSADQYCQFLLQSNVKSKLVEFHIADGSCSRSLKMVSIVDILEDGLSAVYTFFEPDDRASYGTYNILWQLQWVQQLGLQYLYLGYWISASPKMNYKARFRPFEVYSDGSWTCQLPSN